MISTVANGFALEVTDGPKIHARNDRHFNGDLRDKKYDSHTGNRHRNISAHVIYVGHAAHHISLHSRYLFNLKAYKMLVLFAGT
jgi:hypothetical protein